MFRTFTLCLFILTNFFTSSPKGVTMKCLDQCFNTIITVRRCVVVSWMAVCVHQGTTRLSRTSRYHQTVSYIRHSELHIKSTIFQKDCRTYPYSGHLLSTRQTNVALAHRGGAATGAIQYAFDQITRAKLARQARRHLKHILHYSTSPSFLFTHCDMSQARLINDNP
jgi:hypothetical protein